MLFKLLLIFCFYLPFQLALNPSTGIDLASGRIFILLLFFIWLAESLKNKKINIGNTQANFFIICFLVLNFISFSVAKNIDWSLRKFLFLLSVFPLYFVFSGLLDTKNKKERVSKALVFSGGAVSLIAIFQFISQFIFSLDTIYGFWAKNVVPLFLGKSVTKAVLKNPSWLVNISGKTYLRSIAMFPDPHMLAFFLGMIVPFSFGLYLKSKKKIYLAIFSIMLLADFLTFSRGGYLGLFLGAGIFFLTVCHKIKKRYQLTISIIFLTGILVLFVPNPISERLFSSFNLKEGSNLGRLETWGRAITIIQDHPFLGTGIGNYPLAINPRASYREPIYAHSIYLDIAAETGLINLFFWLGLIATLIFDFAKKAKRDIFFFCAMLSIIIFSGHALVETPLYSPIILPLFLIIASFDNEKNN
jgi:O-antigen ligase